MHMHLLDWLIVLIPLTAVIIIAAKTYGHTKSVADFMAANRVANRYLLANAAGEAGSGLIGVVAGFEMLFVAGFAVGWWNKLSTPVTLLIALSGYVIYRYRQTRVMTMSQFFEIRYSKKFRIFAGMLAFVTGVVNFGIFPAVGARFFVYYCGFPQTVALAGFTIPTFAILMVIFLSTALFLTIMGGQLTIMVVDCIEGLISGLFYLIVIFTLLYLFSWSQISEAMSAVPKGQSLLNPFDTLQTKDFNIWFVLIGIFGSIYGYCSWQGSQGFRAAAANAHEAKMANILGSWRNTAKGLMFTLLGICAYTYLKHADFSAGALSVNEYLKIIDNPQIQKQMRAPVALAFLLPVGIKGVLASIMLFGMLAGDGAYMHSWGGIFIQDVVLPFRKKPFEPKQHIRLLRCSIVGVAVFAFVFSLLYRQTDYILMFFALTGALYSGAGAAIIGGLYWKKGTAAAAWASLITGSTLAVTGIVLQQVWPGHLGPWMAQHYPQSAYLHANLAKFPINGQWIAFISQLTAVTMYVTLSLLTCREGFNMDRMLHRGKYAVETTPAAAPALRRKFSLGTLIGIDREFTRGDKIISISVFGWSMFWFGVWLVCTIWNLISPWPLGWWSKYWHVASILMPVTVGVVTTVWFTWGGTHDLLKLFKSLRAAKLNTLDDGRVVGHVSVADVELVEKVDHITIKEAHEADKTAK
jgi:solute:Na+ symporter, SSS family